MFYTCTEPIPLQKIYLQPTQEIEFIGIKEKIYLDLLYGYKADN